MVRSITFLVIWAAFQAAAFAGELDLTPQESTYLAEATPVPCVAFRNGTASVSYSPPGAWKVSGGGRKVAVMPPNAVQAGATIQVIPVSETAPVTEASLKAYAEFAAGLLPREVSKVKVMSLEIAPMRICNHAMADVTLSYSLFGQTFTTNVLVLPYDKQELAFTMTARSADFTPLARTFRGSLFSIQGL